METFKELNKFLPKKKRKKETLTTLIREKRYTKSKDTEFAYFKRFMAKVQPIKIEKITTKI